MCHIDFHSTYGVSTNLYGKGKNTQKWATYPEGEPYHYIAMDHELIVKPKNIANATLPSNCASRVGNLNCNIVEISYEYEHYKSYMQFSVFSLIWQLHTYNVLFIADFVFGALTLY